MLGIANTEDVLAGKSDSAYSTLANTLYILLTLIIKILFFALACWAQWLEHWPED